MSIGFLIGAMLHGALVALTLVAPRRPRWLAGLGHRVAAAYNELPFLFIYLLLLGGLPSVLRGEVDTLTEWLILAVGVIVVAALAVIAWRGAQARPAVEAALASGLGADWREELEIGVRDRLRRSPPWANILFMPFVLRGRGVERIANLSYGPEGQAHLLDLYRPTSRPAGAPVLIYLHPGGFYSGNKSREGRALLFHLARRGWVTISGNYRLRPHTDYFGHLLDLKRLIAWVRSHGREYGADPAKLFLSGGSAGGNLAAMAALTQNQARYQPGLERADTSVTGVASFYGWYGGYYGMGGPESEVGLLGHPAAGAPPFFVAHGPDDSLAHVESARRFVRHLRSGSKAPVVYAELPGAQHTFDLFHSLRSAAVVDGVEAFTAWVLSQGRDVARLERGEHRAPVAASHGGRAQAATPNRGR